MRLYRARAWRGAGTPTFDPLDYTGSTRGLDGWRFNDISTPLLYAAEVEALAILEVSARPGWATIQHILVATIDVPEGSIVSLADLGIVLPSNWNARPAAADSRLIGREFLNAVAARPAGASRPIGVRVPSVLSGSDHNVLIDPSCVGELQADITGRIPFSSLLSASTQRSVSE